LEADIPSEIPNRLAKAIDAATLSFLQQLLGGRNAFGYSCGPIIVRSALWPIPLSDDSLSGSPFRGRGKPGSQGDNPVTAIRVDVCGPGALREGRTGMPRRGRNRRRRFIELVFGPRIVLGW